MSFDLGVWRPARQLITADQAERFYADLCSRPLGSFVPGPEMQAFADSVVERYRKARAATDHPWAAPPDVSEDCVLMAIQSDLADDVFPIVRELARERGLVCYSPRNSVVYEPAPPGAAGSSYVLEVADGRNRRVVYGPDAALVEASVRALSEVTWFVILERTQNFYIQAGCGDRAGAPRGHYAIEYRDGGPIKHWRSIASSLDQLVPAFLDYMQGGMEWTAGFSWTRPDL